MKDVQRLCQICRCKFKKQDLNRIVCFDGTLFLDNKKEMPKKACYICKNEKCINEIIKKKTFNRVFKQNFDISSYNKILEEIKIANDTVKQS